MTQYAYYDHTASPAIVTGWFDTEVFDYTLPDAADLFEVTIEQWDARMDFTYQIQAGMMIPYTPPPPTYTIEDQARILLANPVTVTCTSLPELDADYAITDSLRQAMIGVVSQINAGMGLPGGGATFNWPDKDNTERQWPEAQFKSFANAVSNFAYNCNQVIGGFSTTLPAKDITIA